MLSAIVLVLLSVYFSMLYDAGRLGDYRQGLSRFVNFTDYSNYFRITVNTNLLRIYLSDPQRLLTGISNDEFFLLNRDMARMRGQAYRAIKPHNYFFSYLQIYGVFSLVIFGYVSSLFKQITTWTNIPIMLSDFSYITFLAREYQVIGFF